VAIHHTPTYGIAYPDDLLPLGDLDLLLTDVAQTLEAALIRGGIAPPEAQDLATLSGQVLNPPTAAPTFQAGWSNQGAPFPALRVWKIGKTAYAGGLVKTATQVAAGGQSNIALLPAGYWPAETILTTQSSNGNTVARVDVQPDGLLKLNLVLSPAVPANAFVTVNATWRLP
jgi:hypothetical protein